MNTQDNQRTQDLDQDQKPCRPGTDATITPPGEVSLVLAGAAVGLSLGFALGAIFAARAGSR